MDRRDVIKAGVAGALTLWATPLLARDAVGRDPRDQAGGRDPRSGPGSSPGTVRKLANNLSVLDAGGSNVVALSSSDGILLVDARSEEHTSELQSRRDLVCRLLLEKKK